MSAEQMKVTTDFVFMLLMVIWTIIIWVGMWRGGLL